MGDGRAIRYCFSRTGARIHKADKAYYGEVPILGTAATIGVYYVGYKK